MIPDGLSDASPVTSIVVHGRVFDASGAEQEVSNLPLRPALVRPS